MTIDLDDLPTRWTLRRGLRGGPLREVKRVQVADGVYAFWLEGVLVGCALRLPHRQYGNPPWQAYLPNEEPIAEIFKTLAAAQEHLLGLADESAGSGAG